MITFMKGLVICNNINGFPWQQKCNARCVTVNISFFTCGAKLQFALKNEAKQTKALTPCSGHTKGMSCCLVYNQLLAS